MRSALLAQNAGARACPAKRGDVFYFHYLTVHGSDVNTTDSVRKTVLLQVSDPADRSVDGMHLASHGQGLMLAGER